jgi:hypothetical protein
MPNDLRAFLLFAWKKDAVPELDATLLKVFVNQAESLNQRLFAPRLPVKT